MPKFTLLGRFTQDRFSTLLPPDYRDLARVVTKPGVSYAVVLFAHDRADVVPSAVVRRALQRVAEPEPILAVGANFTAEATQLLDARAAAIARLGEFHWTDATWAGIRDRAT